jgi:hypothetical protein
MSRRRSRGLWLVVGLALIATLPSVVGAAQARPAKRPSGISGPTFRRDVAHDVSPSLRRIARTTSPRRTSGPASREIRPDRGRTVADAGHSPDGALQSDSRPSAIAGTNANFEGLSSQDNFNTLGFRVNPPDSDGDVGPNHYVEMINLVLAVYDKAGNKLLGPMDIGSVWSGFAIPDCADQSGDPIVLHDQFANRWLLSQFTTSGLDDPSKPFWNCVAISTTADPTGSYYRYAFETENFQFFPDYPKYGVWTNTYTLTTREFGPTVEYGIGVYGLEKNKMLRGRPARSVSFFLDGNNPSILPLVGDGLLPADIDGRNVPPPGAKIPIIGTQDDGGGYGATFDALNVWDFQVFWTTPASATLALNTQLPTAAFDSIFPCAPGSRDCLPQPGITDPAQYLDILSYRQRPTWRLAYRRFSEFETMVTNQSVEATPGVAGVRWYEVRRTGGTYSINQQGTYAPGDGVHRWMGSVAMDRRRNIALGYSVVNGTSVFPGIRYTGRMAFDPAGQMTLGEGVIVNGSGVQTSTNSRWGDYTSLNVDPVDDCTFWYVNEYYTAAGQASSSVGWQTRIASFKLC